MCFACDARYADFYKVEQERLTRMMQKGSNPFALPIDVLPLTRGPAGEHSDSDSDSDGSEASTDERSEALLADNKWHQFLRHSLALAEARETAARVRATARTAKSTASHGVPVEAKRAGAAAFLATVARSAFLLRERRAAIMSSAADDALAWALGRAKQVQARAHGSTAKRSAAFAYLRCIGTAARHIADKADAMWKEHNAPAPEEAPEKPKKPTIKRLRSMRAPLRSPRQVIQPGELPGLDITAFTSMMKHLMPRDTKVMAELPKAYVRLLFRQVSVSLRNYVIVDGS